jgi:hypothetical protein
MGKESWAISTGQPQAYIAAIDVDSGGGKIPQAVLTGATVNQPPPGQALIACTLLNGRIAS